jgi:RHS repeat-associated protein
VLRETWDNNTLVPLYDNEDSVCGIIYNDDPYYFIKNQQGDVIAIVDKDVNTVAGYVYDAWGKPSIKFDNSSCQIASINPYRYRCYYYDAEIGMYYLQCRYYDPQTSRFINSDEGLILTVSKNILNANIFVYCHNNPINEVDYFGYLSFWKRAYYLVHGVFLITTGLLAIISAIRKGFVAAALGSFTANLIASLVGTALGLMPLGQYWGTIIAVTMIISLIWHLKSMLYNIPAGLAEIKKALS